MGFNINILDNLSLWGLLCVENIFVWGGVWGGGGGVAVIQIIELGFGKLQGNT